MLVGPVIAYLADRVGMDQFLDVGAGLPTVQNTHEVAQRWNPEARVVYIDNDPAVNAYGRALLVENDQRGSPRPICANRAKSSSLCKRATWTGAGPWC